MAVRAPSFADGGAEPVGGGAHGRRVDFGGEEESGGVGAELDPEGGEEVDEFEGVAAGALFVESGEGGGGDDEEEEGHEEADGLHALAAVELVVEEEGGEVVADELAADVDEVVEPEVDDLVGVAGHEGEEDVAEDLVAVEGEVVAEPAEGGGEEAVPVVPADELQGFDVVAGDVVALPGCFEGLVCVLQLEDSDVDEEQQEDCNEAERYTKCVLRGSFTIGRVST